MDLYIAEAKKHAKIDKAEATIDVTMPDGSTSSQNVVIPSTNGAGVTYPAGSKFLFIPQGSKFFSANNFSSSANLVFNAIANSGVTLGAGGATNQNIAIPVSQAGILQAIAILGSTVSSRALTIAQTVFTGKFYGYRTALR